MNIVTKWTGEGAIICIEDTNDNNKNEFDVIWNRMKNEILDMLRGCDIELLIRSGATVKLRAKVFDKPIGDLAGVPWREKRHYAGLIWSKFTQCYEFFEKALQDPKNIEEINNGKPKPGRSYEFTGDILDHDGEFKKFFKGLTGYLKSRLQKIGSLIRIL